MSTSTSPEPTLTKDEIQAIVRDELEQQVEATAEQSGYSRRQILAALAGGGVAAALLGGATGEASAAAAATVGEPGAVLVAIYANAIKDTNDATLIDLSGSKIDAQVPISLYSVTSDPASPAAGDMWYRSDLD